ncbi:MAG: MBL fold metallo-hydrolase [Proteobacteria bacterium]|nr:MBL fold metallo-hydrolase [Pseudomonadota bacterium]
MRFASLGSGSKGNATLVQAGDTLLMIDCGFSLRETTRRLARLGLEPAQLDAILVTHEHTDHSSGVAILSRKHQIPVYLTHGTFGSGRCDNCFSTRPVGLNQRFSIGAVEVQAIAVPHDAREPCQYRFFYQGKSLGVLTDLGSITPHVVDSYRSCDALVLEFNHDRQLLQNGVYPHHLKRRVGGDWGHLNNMQAAALLDKIHHAALRHLVVAHVSENNNSRQHAEKALLSVLESLDDVVWADQGEGFDWLVLD